MWNRMHCGINIQSNRDRDTTATHITNEQKGECVSYL